MTIGSTTPGSPPPDLPSLLLCQRIVYLGMPLTSKTTELIIGELLWLNFSSPDQTFHLYINSPGSYNVNGDALGLESEVYAILDTLEYISPQFDTLCIGQAFGNAALLLASGTRGNRASLPNACIITYAPRMNRRFGRIVDQMINSNDLNTSTLKYVENLARFTGKSKSELENILRLKKFWTPDTAVEYGIIDRIMSPRK